MTTDSVRELQDLELEAVAGGKTGGGGGGGGGRRSGGDAVARGFNNLSRFQDFQARSFINSGVNPGSSAFERLSRRGIDLSAVQLR